MINHKSLKRRAKLSCQLHRLSQIRLEWWYLLGLRQLRLKDQGLRFSTRACCIILRTTNHRLTCICHLDKYEQFLSNLKERLGFVLWWIESRWCSRSYLTWCRISDRNSCWHWRPKYCLNRFYCNNRVLFSLCINDWICYFNIMFHNIFLSFTRSFFQKLWELVWRVI